MLKSMTGYGRGECTLYNRKIIVEIKSVNHRYNDVNIKLPRIMSSLEDGVRKTVSKQVFRGKTDVYISYETLSKDDIRITFNEALADSYVSELRKIAARYSLKDEPSLSLIAHFPDIISIDKNMDDEKTLSEVSETLDKALEAALSEFISMRIQEGDALKRDILEKLSTIRALTEKVSERAPYVSENYSQKLSQKLSEALSGVEYDEGRFLTEITIFADKSCIDEEITRLKSHIVQMDEIINEKISVGRKLDFLVQEMNREVNTIGSKAGDIEITKLIVEMKSEIEKIREQVQNIE